MRLLQVGGEEIAAALTIRAGSANASTEVVAKGALELSPRAWAAVGTRSPVVCWVEWGRQLLVVAEMGSAPTSTAECSQASSRVGIEGAPTLPVKRA